MPSLKKRLPPDYARSFLDRALGLFPAGAALFLTKPFSPNQLLTETQRILSGTSCWFNPIYSL